MGAGNNIMAVFRRKNVDVLSEDVSFYSERHGKTTTAPKGFCCDGASGVKDTKEKCYRIHDWAFFAALWDDGSAMSFEEANHNYTDLLRKTGHWFYSRTRKTLYFVGRKAWEEHRRREMTWQNTKVLAQWMNDRGIHGGKNT